MIRFIVPLALSVLCMLGASAQSSAPTKPQLVVGIVVDQMRQEYLYRFESKFREGGFKRLMDGGFMLENVHYNYVPTYTGPGHASIYTGTTPAIHGVIGNDWYDKQLKKIVNCVEDPNQKAVGSVDGNGDVSPSRMLSSTITDELKLASQKKSMVVGISFKDRGAVLPAGHHPDGAYWYDGLTGRFITSTYYRMGLPAWLESFNNLNLADKYLSQEWKTVLPVAQYVESGPDDSPYEAKLRGMDKSGFPYNLKELRRQNGDFELLAATPFGDDLLTEMAKAVIDGEALGKDEITDFLAISFSSPDIIGHRTGPNSVEIEDTYIRLDKNLEDLFKKLDKEVGQGRYLIFLTADHAVADNPQYLKDNSIPADYFRIANVEAGLSDFLEKYFPGKKVIEKISNDQIFLNQDLFGGDPRTSGIDLLIATELITKYLQDTPGVAQVYSESNLRQGDFNEGGTKGMMIRGFHHKRSGDISVVLEPGWIASQGGLTGTTHGSAYTYDTHVPLLFYGTGIKKGSSSQYHPITDIAPTLSILLKIKFPSGCTGQPISELAD